MNSSQENRSFFLFAETDEWCVRNTKFLLVLRSLDLATISFPGRTSISFVDGEDPPIALDLCTSIPAGRRQEYVQSGAGHYGVFSGRRWREEIAPRIASFIRGS